MTSRLLLYSQGRGLCTSRRRHRFLQQLRREDIDTDATEKLPGLPLQPGRAHEYVAVGGIHVHEDVDVTPLVGVTPGHGSEEPRVCGSILVEERIQLIPARSDQAP